MKTIKRKFTTEFKEEAVRLVVREGLSTPEAARRIEISDETLANWVRLARRGQALSSGDGIERKASSVSELEMEVSKLRAENARLKMEKEILKNRPRRLPRPKWIETGDARL
jgi:transposase